MKGKREGGREDGRKKREAVVLLVPVLLRM